LIDQDDPIFARRFLQSLESLAIGLSAAGLDDERGLFPRRKCCPKSANDGERILAFDLAVHVEHEKKNVMVIGDTERFP